MQPPLEYKYSWFDCCVLYIVRISEQFSVTYPYSTHLYHLRMAFSSSPFTTVFPVLCAIAMAAPVLVVHAQTCATVRGEIYPIDK